MCCGAQCSPESVLAYTAYRKVLWSSQVTGKCSGALWSPESVLVHTGHTKVFWCIMDPGKYCDEQAAGFTGFKKVC